MFRAAPVNPYDDLVQKATNEDLLSEDWETNLLICDKVQEEGENGAKNAVAALLKRLTHRNPNVQIFALELANSLAQNCGRPAHAELSSRAWTGALDRLVSDRTTLPQVKARTLKFIKQWNDQFGSDPSLGVMRELYDSLRARKVEFEGVTDSAGRGRGASAGAGGEDEEERRERIRREEEEELQRVLELSKQDKGGRGDAQTKQGQGSGSGSGSGTQAVSGTSSSIAYPEPHAAATATTTAAAPQPYAARNPTPPPPMPTKATASRVRAIYPFTTTEKGELSFNKGDVIKVIDRMYDEWYTGAVDGRIGIFPVSYVEPMPDPTPAELANEAREEARVFAAQGMIVALQRMLDSLDPSRGDRLDDPELEELYRKTVALQPEIVGLMKKYSDQKAELEHIHLGFIKAQRQYAQMTQPQMAQPGYPGMAYPGQYPQEYAQRPGQDHRASSHGSVPGAMGQPYPQQGYPSPQLQHGQPEAQPDQATIAAAWAQYYQQQQMAAATSAPQGAAGGASPATNGAAPPQQSQEEREKVAAAWQAYYAAQAQYAQQMAAAGYSQQQIQQMQAQSQAQSQGQSQGHRTSGDSYSASNNAPVQSDAGSVRSLSMPSGPSEQGHAQENSPYAQDQAPYGHQSRASLSMPQPQIQSYPSQQNQGAQMNYSQSSLETAAPVPPAKDQYLSTPAAPGINMTASPQPIQSSPYPPAASAQRQESFAPPLQHSRSSENYGQQPGQHAYHTNGAVSQPSQPQTGLEAAVGNLAFR